MELKKSLPHSLTALLPLYFLLFVGLLVVIGTWLASSIVRQAPPPEPATLGQLVRVPGGTLRVEAVRPQHVAPMHNNKFQKAGMAMTGMNMDMPRRGYQRVLVAFTIAGEGRAGLQYRAEDFYLLTADGGKIVPLRASIGSGSVPRGSAASGSLLFEVPATQSSWQLRFRNATQPVRLDLSATTPHHHDNQEHHDH